MSNQRQRLFGLAPLIFVAAPVVLVATAARWAPMLSASVPPPVAVRAVPTHPLFVGILLSADQQHRVDSIRAAFGAQARAIVDEFRPSVAASHAARAHHDTVAMNRIAAGVASGKAKLAALLVQERTELRAVLSPAQQPVFDKNREALEEREARGRKGMH